MIVLTLRSSFQTDDFVRTEYAELLQGLTSSCSAECHILGDEAAAIEQWKRHPFVPDAFMVATGGVENLFKTVWTATDVETLCAPRPKTVTLIADGRNNSLAASLEILTWLEGQGVEARILHGTNDEIIASLLETQGIATLRGVRIGLFGKPSDWLIASDVDREYLRSHYGVETLDIDLQRLVDGIKAVSQKDAVKVAQAIVKQSEDTLEPSCADMVEAAKAYLAIKQICLEERLNAMTIRCFDIVKACGTTSCLALALLNDEGIVAGCEGDMQTLMSMLLAKRLCGTTAFMANPSQLTEDTSMLAHCTIPLTMCDTITLRSHFESGIGVAIQGVLPLTDYTVFKWGGPKLDRYFVTEAKAVETRYSNHFCRTQITLDANLKPYLLQHSIGNHHVVIRGKHADAIKRFMEQQKSFP